MNHSSIQMKNHLLALTVFVSCSLLTGIASAAKTPNSLSTDDRVRQVMYDPNQVYEIVGTYGYQTSIEFAEDETVKVVSLGDTIAWQTVPYNNRVFLKPVEPKATTNMTVITDKRTYYFMLSSGKLSKETTFLVRFKYPNNTPFRSTTRSTAKGLSSTFNPESINLDYSTSGNTSAIQVEKILDDGEFTFFRFASKSEIPTIYTVGADGTESIVNTRREGNFYVVERTSSLFTLRSGTEYLCVRSKSKSSNNAQPNNMGDN